VCSGPDYVAPFTTAPTPTSGPPYAPSEWFLAVYHEINITAGCSPTNDGASSAQPPCALGVNGSLARRFVVSPASERLTPLQTIASYAADNGMVAGGRNTTWATQVNPTFPTLREKLSAAQGPEFWRQVYASALLKMDALAIALPFANYSSQASQQCSMFCHSRVHVVTNCRLTYDIPLPNDRFATCCCLGVGRCSLDFLFRAFYTTAHTSSMALTQIILTCCRLRQRSAQRVTWWTAWRQLRRWAI
jgi:hypothetical protein